MGRRSAGSKPNRTRALGVLVGLISLSAVLLSFPAAAAQDPEPDPRPVPPDVEHIPVDVTEIPTTAIQSTPTPGPTAEPESTPTLQAEPVETEEFSLVGVSWQRDPGVRDVQVEIRVRVDGTWTDWAVTEELHGGTDMSTDEDDASARTVTEPIWVGQADAAEVRIDPGDGAEPRDVQIEAVDPGESPADETVADAPPAIDASPRGEAAASGDEEAPQPAESAESARSAESAQSLAAVQAAAPAIISRTQWGADESLRCGPPSYTGSIKAGFVHHTASGNSYGPEDSAAVVRSIYAYHTQSRGYCDIGYNFLIDKFGRIFEGRYGGVDRSVLGAHTGGFNARSFGMSFIGNFETAAAPADMMRAGGELLAWKLGLSGVDPHGQTQLTSSGGGTSKFPAGTVVTFNTISGHRDAGYTSCPGNSVYNRLGELRQAAAGSQSNPFGYVDVVASGIGWIRSLGWTADPDAPTSPIDAHMYVDGWLAAKRADVHRPDVGAAFSELGPAHGYDIDMQIWGGPHTVCLVGVNVGPGRDTQLGCYPVTLPGGSPIGAIEGIGVWPGVVRLVGWTLDPDMMWPITVHAYVNSNSWAAAATVNRPDIATRYPGYGAAHGFDILLPLRAGWNDVCIYGIDFGIGENVQIGCDRIWSP